MTVYSNNSPKKAIAYGQHTRRTIFHKKYACLWVLVALLPFLVLRLVFFYASPFLLFGAPAEGEAELRTELEFPAPDFHLKSSSLPPGISPVGNRKPNSGPAALPQPKTSPPKSFPPRKETVFVDDLVDKDPGSFTHVHKSTGSTAQEEQEDLGKPEDNEDQDAENWQAPPDEKTVDEQNVTLVPLSIAPTLPPTLAPNLPPASVPTAPGKCDLYDGDWVPDPEGPLYNNETCFYMQGHQNCMSNGRPDTGYLYWKWQPRYCELPRFDGQEFLRKFWGRTIGFIGDSLSRNQMQSLLCMLSRVERPVMIYQSEGDKNVRWLFKNHQVTLATVWSPYLLRETTSELKGVKEGESKLYTDLLDDEWTSVMKDFDVMVLSIGQWYFKSSIYIENDEFIGCHYCPGKNFTEIGFFQAYRKAIRHVLDKVSRDYQGLAVMSTFALEHFENGSWDSGGSCTREHPLTKEEFPLQGLNNDMHQIVMEEYFKTVNRKRKGNKVQLDLLDVTRISLLRADGHPGPYREYHPFEGKPPGTHVQNDCLHWCLPGPVDTWNQFLVQAIDSHLTK